MFASAAALLSLASLWMLRRSVDATEFHELQDAPTMCGCFSLAKIRADARADQWGFC